MNVIEAVARILKIEGVEWVSCFPSNLLIEAVAKEGIRTIMFRHERGAIMAADGFSRMNDRNKFGVVITQGGPVQRIPWAVSPRHSATMSLFCTCPEARL